MSLRTTPPSRADHVGSLLRPPALPAREDFREGADRRQELRGIEDEATRDVVYIAHVCLRADDGIVIVDTCPTREAFEAFLTGDEFRSALRRHGLPEPSELHDYPVHALFVDGATAIAEPSSANST